MPVEVVHARLREELTDLSSGRGDLPVDARRGLLVAMVPEVAARLGTTLAGREETDPRHAVEMLLGEEFYGAPALGLRDQMAAHLEDYVASLGRWADWTPLELHAVDDGIWVQTWHRETDGMVAADYVGLVDDPADRSRPSPAFARFDAEAMTVHEFLREWHLDDYRGLRTWILGDDGRSVARWIHDLDEDRWTYDR